MKNLVWAGACVVGLVACNGYVSEDEEHRKWQDACTEKDDKEACAAIGNVVAHGDGGVKTDGKKAVEFLEKGCKGDVADACFTLGEIYSKSLTVEGIDEDLAKARKYYDKGCEGKVAGSSEGKKSKKDKKGDKAEKGDKDEKGDKAEKDDKDEKEAKSSKKKKAGADADACNAVAKMYMKGDGGDKDGDKGISAYEKACEKGLMKACETAASALTEGKGVDKDEKRAAKIYLKPCKNKDVEKKERFEACEKAAKGIEDAGEKLALWEELCQEGSKSTCENLGMAYIKTDEAKAFTFFAKSCELSEGAPDEYISCQLAGNLAAFKVHKPEDAVRLATRGCDARHGGSCYALASFYISSESGLPTDRDKSISLMRKACDYGDSDACKVVASL
jgi:TPR repeat protein